MGGGLFSAGGIAHFVRRENSIKGYFPQLFQETPRKLEDLK